MALTSKPITASNYTLVVGDKGKPKDKTVKAVVNSDNNTKALPAPGRAAA